MPGGVTGGRTGPPDGRRPAGHLRRLLPHLRPLRLRLIGAMAASVGVLGAQVGQPQIVKRVVDEVLEGGMRERLVPYALAALALGVLGASMAFIRRNLSGSVSLGLENDVRNRLYAHLQRLSVSFHDGWQSGQLVSRAVSDIGRIRRFLGFGLIWLFILAMTFFWVLLAMFLLDVWLALVMIVFAVPVALVSLRFARRYFEISQRSQDQLGDLTTIIEESATGIRVIKAFGRGPERSDDFAQQGRVLMGTQLEGVRARATFWSLDHVLLGSSLVVTLLLGGSRVAGGSLTLGGLVAFMSYQLLLTWPVRDIGWIIAMAEEAVAASERVFEILDAEPDIADSPGASVLTHAVGHVRLDGVSFGYADVGRQVLADLDLEVAPGETLALVGMTGSGKTSIAALVPRFHDPERGRVTLDGFDLRDLTLASLRSHIGVAFEDPILFSASVRENVLMGHPQGSDDDVWEALRIANADEFVRELPWGLDTRVGEQGHSLSGGQRQRVALARAVIGRPRVLVLDNPLSSVDVHTEAEIEDALRSVLEGRTALLVAHRPSTILLADRVALIHEGRVVATGRHHDLLHTVPLYREVLAKDASDSDEREGVGV